MLNKPKILNHKGGLIILIMGILFVCYFIWFMCSIESVGWVKFEVFGDLTWWIFQLLVVISLLAINISFKLHRSLLPLVIGFLSTIVIFHAYHFEHDESWQIEMAVGMFGFTIGSFINIHKLNKMDSIDRKRN